jgi:NAD(P)-dependent dehydrogenase (short-subunit alcohol dehydrogenase family)
MKSLPMQEVLVITGASRGIGRACALKAARPDLTIIVNYLRNSAAAESTVAQIHQAGGEAVAVQGDVSAPGDIERLFTRADESGRLTGLINNAGIVASAARVDEMTPERIQHMMQVNIVGPFLCARQAVLRMSTRHGGKGGAIVNLGSVAARLGSPGQYIDYAASKAAIDTFTIGLAREVAGEGIRVNCVRPGIIDTDIHASGGEPDRVQQLGPTAPMKREGSAEEVANGVLWLLGDEASYSTGSILDITGGR